MTTNNTDSKKLKLAHTTSKDEDTDETSKTKDQEVVVYKLLKGSVDFSEYLTISLIVPQSQASFIFQALKRVQNQYQWSICEDEITNVENILGLFDVAFPIRTIQYEDIPTNRSESELLDWLIHGESYFAKKYVVFKCSKGSYRFDSTHERIFEITKKEHLKFTDVCKNIYYTYNEYIDEREIDRYDDDTINIESCEIYDRGTFLRDFADNWREPEIVNDEKLRKFEEGIRHKDDDDFLFYIEDLIW